MEVCQHSGLHMECGYLLGAPEGQLLGQLMIQPLLF